MSANAIDRASVASEEGERAGSPKGDPARIDPPDRRAAWARVQRLLWTAVVGLSAFTATNVLLTLTSTEWASAKIAAPVFGPSIVANNLFLLGHVLLALPCILTGPFLFMDRFRETPRAWIHRWIGYAYVVPVLISAVIGFVLAACNTHGPMAKAGFSTLAVIWFSSTAIALRYALQRDWLRHRQWMLRSYAISLAVVTVRFIPPPFGMTKMEWYPYMTWACWIPNVLLGEVYVRMTSHKGSLIRPAFLLRVLSRREAVPTAERP